MNAIKLKIYTILIIVLLILFGLNLTSCKKDNNTKPKSLTTNTITHYQRVFTANSCGANTDLYIYENNGVITMSDPILSAYPDTMYFDAQMRFNQLHNNIGIIVAGGITIDNVNNTLTMRFLQTKASGALNPDCYITDLIYNRIP